MCLCSKKSGLVCLVVLTVSLHFYYQGFSMKQVVDTKIIIEDSTSKADNGTEKKSSLLNDNSSKEYKGPIVEGWPPDRDRNISIYIRPDESLDKLILSNTSCFKQKFENTKLLIIVQSAPTMFERRQDNRETWMSSTLLQNRSDNFSKSQDIETIFLFGYEPDQDNEALKEEQEKYCDIVQFDFVDHYSNVTLDTVFALRFTLEFFGEKNLLKRPEFLLIADDDTYVHIPLLRRKYLTHKKPRVTKDSQALVGAEFKGTKVHFPEKGKFKPLQVLPYNQKTYCPRYMYNKTVFPDYVSGAGYLLPQTVLECFYKTSLSIPYFHINDIFLTGMVRKKCEVKIVNDISYSFIFPGNYKPLVQKRLAVIHYATGAKKRMIHELMSMSTKDLVKCEEGTYCLNRNHLYHCGDGEGYKCKRVIF